ncbi:centromere/kinetochore protein zw10 homolog [Dreissena polymorpha]|uniref:Centromere/kinetochore protein zw10 n=1 Tax=Dreissena polymorpha TaxID=45954 RepID=A0A9D4N0T0_DREPO|nr:centromere/kinetochore protein zw10 homolog [Dreissena polymorpha]KAH3885199.1 hypothetical protein DPMN_009191 [Dreissena polymorpha]
MASFVAEVLTTTGQLETQEASSKIQQLNKKIDGLKLQVYDVTVNKYTNIQSKLNSTEQLVSDVQATKQEMNEVSDRIEKQIKSQLHMSTVEFETLTGNLEDITCLLVVLEKLVNLQNGLEAMETSIQAHDYSRAADTLDRVRSLLAQKVFGHEDELSILSTIQQECSIKKERLNMELNDKWKELIVWDVPSEKVKNETGSKVVRLKINTASENGDLLRRTVLGMSKMKILESKVRDFGEKLFQHMIQLVTVRSKCEVSGSETETGVILSVEVLDSDEADVVPVVPHQVFLSLEKLLSFLNQHFLHIIVTEGSSENEVPETLMSILGGFIADKSLEQVVKQCLVRAIPSSHKDLQELDNIVLLTNEFHKKLMELHFINKDNTILQDFVQNVNTLFANKKCQEILERAHKLVTTEVHNTITVSQDRPLGKLPPLWEGKDGSGGKKARRDEVTSAQAPLSVNTFRLPTCQISASIQELVTLAYETLQEASVSSAQCAIQLFCAVRGMFELYCSVFPIYHRRSLQTLPQFSALHYTNSMYIAHHLMTLGHQFSRKLPSTINSTFVDLVPKIRRAGSDSFVQQLKKQKSQMSEYLSAANGFMSVSEPGTQAASERAVKQVLHQLQHLHNIWQTVLPPTNYRKAIGGLLNGVVVEITDSVVALEDVSSTDAAHISSLITSIVVRADQLFTIDGETSNISVAVEIHRNVSKWQRLKELDMVLNASLTDIANRWAEGKGPLGVAFSANELKQLIRALFQNTERRAALLAKIK